MAATVAVLARRCRLRGGTVRLLAQPRQSIVFAQQRDNRLAAAEAGNKCIWNATGFARQVKTFGFQRAGEPFG
jgi:hypothetical protein